MTNQLMQINIDYLQDPEGFFDIIDTCNSSVNVILPDQTSKDLRNNYYLQYLLTWMAPAGIISDVKLVCDNSHDVERLTKFIGDTYYKD